MKTPSYYTFARIFSGLASFVKIYAYVVSLLWGFITMRLIMGSGGSISESLALLFCLVGSVVLHKASLSAAEDAFEKSLAYETVSISDQATRINALLEEIRKTK